VIEVGRQTALAIRRIGEDRRGWIYLGGTAVAAVAAGFIASIVVYAVVAGAAIGAWVTRQTAVVRWSLTVLAVALIVALVLGFSGSATGHGSTGGPTAPG
jgi:hypothetical protein